uniref:Dendritic cell-specific transmembrane protein-like domain-containing protein n=1 Tax=Parascaris univalens TaxID=6257 RepID=A0A914ZU26_PARUN
MWSIILICSITFALSPVFRCAIICVLCGALGKNGQGLLSVVVFTHLSEGPINNIISNFNLSAHIITCHLKLKEQMMTERIIMSTGPIEALLAEKFGKSTSKGRKLIHMLKSLVEPIGYDLSLSDEDKALAATIDNAEILQRRDAILNEKKESKLDLTNEYIRPIWEKLKSKASKLLTMRLHFQCSEVFDKGIKKCHDKFRDMKDKCYNILWYIPFINRAVCGKFDILQICQAAEKHAEAAKFCDEMMERVMGKMKSFDTDTENMQNVTDEVLDHLRVNMHYKAIEEPRLTRIYRLKQVVYRISQNFHIVKMIFSTIKHLLGCLFIFLLYTIFRNSIQMIRNYLNNIDFLNIFLTPYFWHIDKKREEAGEVFLRPLSKAERKINGLLKPFSPPTRAEIEASWQPLAKFFITLIVALLVLLVDNFFYSIIKEVSGTGFVADLIKDMINFDFDKTLNLTIPLEHCHVEPTSPDWSFSWKYVILPLTLMLLLQVVFGYFIKRITLFYIIGGIFRKRNKARTIHLYNKLLFGRVNSRRLARARIRYQVERRILQREAIKEQSKLFAGTFIQTAIIEKLFATGKCLLCEMKYRKSVLVECPNFNCPATYCRTCFTEIHQQCYACLAEEGIVTSERTQFMPSEPSPNEAQRTESLSKSAEESQETSSIIVESTQEETQG